MKKEYLDYIEDIINSIKNIENFTEGMDFEIFEKDEKTSHAVIRALEIIGEAARNIPEEIRKKYPKVPLRDAVGMRDKLIHEYFGVNKKVVWNTIKNDLPILKEGALEILDRA